MAETSSQAIRIVYLEDDHGAFSLVKALLEEDGIVCQLEHVENEEDYVRAISPGQPELILADFNLPTMDGLVALEIKRRLCPATPFIFVSGSLGEDVAIDALKNGATDFVLKDAPARLPSSVRRALSEGRQLREKQAAEQKLRMLSQAVEQSPVGVVITDLKGNIVFANPKMCAMTGYDEAELVGRNVRVFRTDQTGLTVFAELWRVITSGDSWHGQFANRRKDGTIVQVRTSISPVRGADGSIRNYLALEEDITQWLEEQERRRRLENQLFQAQKLESIGTLAGGIAHDFNNILTGILGYCELATLACGNDPTIQQELLEIRAGGMRAKDLVAQILTFSRQSDVQLVPLDLARPVGEALKLIRASTPATIEIDRYLETGFVRADATQIHQVVVNLCTNAVHAMRDQPGRLNVMVRRVDVDDRLASEVQSLDPGPSMMLMVSDTGHGMDEATMSRIFDPFFTTKKHGEGTGLGLAIVQGIVATHNGAVRVISTPGAGTKFEVYLPFCEQTADPSTPQSRVPQGCQEEILVVDDEKSVARFTSARLQQLGYRVTTFQDPRQALAAHAATPARYQAIVTDLTMPHITGVDLVQQIRARGSDIPAVIISGYSKEAARAKLELLPRSIVLPKPFSGDDLARALHRLLHS